MTSPLPDSELQAIAERAEAAREAIAYMFAPDTPFMPPVWVEAALGSFRQAASPEVVLRLIAEIKRLKGEANG